MAIYESHAKSLEVRIVAALFYCCALLLLALTANAAIVEQGAATAKQRCIIWRIHPEPTKPNITCYDYAPGISLKYDSATKAGLDKLAVGTIVEFTKNAPGTATDVADIKIARAKVGGLQYIEAVGVGSVAALLFACAVAGAWPIPSVRSLLVGMDGRYSNSKVQAAAWMGAIFIAFTGTCMLRWLSGMHWSDATNIGIPANLLSLAAVSAATAGGAKIVTGSRQATKTAVNPASGAGTGTSLLDLFRNDGGGQDIGDAQMILVACASIILFAVDVAARWKNLPLSTHIDLPDTSNALTYAFGGSMGGYLAKKIGGSTIQ